MTIEKINGNTWRIEDGFVRCLLLEGSEKAVLIDTGATCADARALAESVTDKPVVLVNTHGDGDHVAGNAAFDSFYMHEADYINCNVAARCPDSHLIPLNDGDIIDAGGRPLEIIAIPGHTRGSAAILDRNERVLYTGDSVQDGHIYMFGAHRQPEAFAASLDKMIGREAEYDCVRAAHGTPELSADFVRKVRAGWQQVLDGALQPREEELHGRTVQTYEAADCGFYCN